MTATITSIAQGYDQGARTYCFHGRTSTVAAGALWTAAAAWWFISQAGVVTKRHHGLELVHTSTYNGERADFLLVDEDGTAEWATHATTTVGSTFDLTVYADADAGNDSNNGLTALTPKLTLTGASGAFSVLRSLSNWVDGGEHRLILQGTFSLTLTGDAWNWNSQSNGGGSTLEGRLHILQWEGQTAAEINITTDNSLTFCQSWQALHVDGVDIIGPYTSGGGAVGASGIGIYAPNASTDGYNVSVLNCEISGFEYGVVVEGTALPLTDMSTGCFDWLSIDNVVFGVQYNTHTFVDRGRYIGFANCTYREIGAGAGADFRAAWLSYASFSSNTHDRSTSSHKYNIWRLRGVPSGGGTWTTTQFISVHNVSVGGTAEEAFELEQATNTGDAYYADIWFHGCSWQSAAEFTCPMFKVEPTSGYSVDITRFRFTNNYGRADAPSPLVRIDVHSSTTTGKVHSVRLDQNTWVRAYSQLFFFTINHCFLVVAGDASNIDDDSIAVLSNYCYCPNTAANSPRAFWSVTSASAKIGASDYNVFASAGTNTTTWSGSDSLATWQAATAFDDNSFQITSASHNMTSVTVGSFDPNPAADGTPSASLPQVRRGMPGLGYADAERYLRDASLPDAGSHEYGTGTLMDDPDFGGGGGSYPNGQTDGFCSYS